MTTSLAQKIARDYGTPAVVIDMDRVERNIARVQAQCDAAGVANRPHIKTHKSPMLAALQRDAGAKGITCQKLGEAEVMADGGLDDILISYNLIGEEKMARLAALMRRINVTVVADNPTVVAGLPLAAAQAERPLSVAVECDTGRKRAGVETPAEAIALAKQIAAAKGLSFAGFMMYPTESGWAEAQAFYDEALKGVREAGLDADDGLDRRLAEPEEPRQAQGRDRAPARHLHLQRPHAGRGRRRHARRLRAAHLFDRGQPRRGRARHPRCRLEDADRPIPAAASTATA